MKLGEMQYIFFVTCMLSVFNVTSQTPCTFGWFGPVCKYKCRCTADSCDLDGVCTGTSRCKPGWFGPACQYADVAYRTNSIPEAIDGNDNTCISSLKEEYIVIELNGSYIFTWLRILLSQAGFLATLQVKYLTKASIMECINGSSFNVDNLTIDIVCHIPMQIFGVNITGEGLKYLCSVYISGGRNLALREKARQTSVYSELINNVRFNFTADKAVDSRPNGRLHQGTGCAHTLQSSSMSEKWCVTFSQPRRINRYVIYNRLGVNGYLLRNFSLVSVDQSGHVQFAYTDSSSVHQDVYTILHPPKIVSRVTIDAGFFPKALCLCEVEVYGDSACPEGWYGWECEYACECHCNAFSFRTHGSCAEDIIKESSEYIQECLNDTYHPACDHQCSQFCARGNIESATCELKSGHCLQGCDEGYMGALCNTHCDAGYFGKDCESECSVNCLPGNDTDSTCHHVTGHCLGGCRKGFSEPLCVRAFVLVTEKSSFGLVGFVIVPAVFALSLVYCLRKRKTKSSPEEMHG